jgi:hypothetical protein
MMSMTRRIVLAAAVLGLVAGTGGRTRADIVALDFTGGFNASSVNGTDQTVGWLFQTNQSIQVTQLGFFDATPGDPLALTHEVGLWASDGTLLTSATVLTDSPLTDSSRYVSISPVDLAAGQTFSLGARYYSPFTDPYRFDASTVTTDPAITHLGAARNASGGGFSFPGIVTTNGGRFGPNFQFTTVTAVPEASTGVMGGLVALVGLGVAWRRRRAA